MSWNEGKWEAEREDSWEERRYGEWRTAYRYWWEYVFEGEWLVPAERIQREIGPEYLMYLDRVR